MKFSSLAGVVALLAMASAQPLRAHVALDGPHGGVVLTAGSYTTITWHPVVQHNPQAWHLHYSLTGGSGPWIPLALNLPVGNPAAGSPHSYQWLVPFSASNQVRVRVTQDNVSGTDYTSMSVGNLSIVLPFSSTVSTLSLSTGGTQPLALDAGSDRAGQSFLLVGSGAGTQPEMSVGGFLVPLVADPYFAYTLANPGAFPLSGSFGSLDAQGAASATFTLPPGLPAVLAGTTFHHAFVVADLSPSLTLASNAVAVTLTP